MSKTKHGCNIARRTTVVIMITTLMLTIESTTSKSIDNGFFVNSLSPMQVYAMDFDATVSNNDPFAETASNDTYISISDEINATISTSVELSEAAKEKANTEIVTDIALENIIVESAIQNIKAEEAYVEPPKVIDMTITENTTGEHNPIKIDNSVGEGYYVDINGYNIYVNPTLNPGWDSSNHITKIGGVYQGPSGKETYYNLPMGGVVKIMRDLGYDEVNWPYWEREDGCKMFGDYIMVAADHSIRPRGSLVETSLGTGIVCDTGSFIYNNPTQLDIAVTW